MIQAVLFDMDGLMVDTESTYWAAGRAMAREYGKEVKDDTLGRMMGRKPLESMQVFAGELGLNADPKQLLKEREDYVLRSMREKVTPMPGLLEAMDELRGRFRMAIVTSAPRYLADVVVDQLKIRDRFDVIQTSDDVTRGKPDPEIYLKAMDKLKVAPAACVVLEDSSNGALAGKRAGAYVIAIPSVYTRSQDFSFADAVATDLVDAARRAAELARQNAPTE